jgi:Terminase large subunit, endonuclease domain
LPVAPRFPSASLVIRDGASSASFWRPSARYHGPSRSIYRAWPAPGRRGRSSSSRRTWSSRPARGRGGPSKLRPWQKKIISYEAVTNGAVTHDGDKRLARHVANAVLRVDSRGSRLQKEHKASRRRIDLAVAAVMAHDRARALASRPKAAIYVLD